VRNSRSFKRSIDHGRFSVELHVWLSVEKATFATFVYQKSSERLLRHFTGTDEMK
jgi:hypothetical protein